MGFNYKKYANLTFGKAFDLLDSFAENMNANIFVVDKDGDVAYANSGAADTYQCSLDDLFDFTGDLPASLFFHSCFLSDLQEILERRISSFPQNGGRVFSTDRTGIRQVISRCQTPDSVFTEERKVI